jgi:hypothetical protein
VEIKDFLREDLGLIIAIVATTAAWLALVGAIRTVRQPREPEDVEPTLELGPEPPALAGFLAGNFKVRRDAVPATLLDLCARDLAEIERVDVDRYICRLKADSPDGLTKYEERVFAHLRKCVRGGIVPAQALTTGPDNESKRWWKAFVNEVVDDSQRRGLSRDLWPRRLALLVALGAAAPAILCGLAWGEDAFFIYLLLPAAVIARVLHGRRQRDTAAGLEAAGRWRAVQAKLAENPVFAEQSPIAVAMWERLLAYGAALGVAPAAIGPIPMGSEPENRAWSTYGGRWHQVDVSYGRWLQWGWHPGIALLVRLGVATLSAAFSVVFGPFVLDVRDDLDGAFQLIPTAFLATAAAVAAVSAYFAVQAALDLFTRHSVTGEVVRLRVKGSDDAKRHYVAVDDGTSKSIRAWVVQPHIYAGLAQGDVVSATVSPRLGYVRSIEAAAATTDNEDPISP